MLASLRTRGSLATCQWLPLLSRICLMIQVLEFSAGQLQLQAPHDLRVERVTETTVNLLWQLLTPTFESPKNPETI